MASRPQGVDPGVGAAPPIRSCAPQPLLDVITAIARASHDVADLVSLGQISGSSGDKIHATGDDAQATAQRILTEHLSQTRVRRLACAREAEVRHVAEDGAYDVTIDPLEGVSVSEANLPFGTIFSIASAEDESAAMLAAGFIHYGPQTNLVIALETGVHIFNLDRAARTYRVATENLRIPDDVNEWAIDATKRRRWPPAIRDLIDEKLGEADAANAVRAAMRWTGSLTADAYRILRLGGVYLCPADAQPGQENACPNLMFAARPIAFVIEKAGGWATTGNERVVRKAPKDHHERTPMIFGSPAVVEQIERLHQKDEDAYRPSPLFQSGGLFRI